MTHETIDLSKFHVLAAPSIRGKEIALNITAKRYMTMTRNLYDAFSAKAPDGHATLLIDDTMKQLCISPEKEGEFHFSKTNRILYSEFAHELEKKGYGLPAKYIFFWDEELQSFVGNLQVICKAPALPKRGSMRK